MPYIPGVGVVRIAKPDFAIVAKLGHYHLSDLFVVAKNEPIQVSTAGKGRSVCSTGGTVVKSGSDSVIPVGNGDCLFVK